MGRKNQEGYYVSRQEYFPDGEMVVEVARGGLDNAGPDMLCEAYPGEGEAYADPKAAIKAAIAVRTLWQKECKQSIKLCVGSTWGGSLPLSDGEEDPGLTDDEAITWAEKEYEKLPKCDRCGEPLPSEPWQNEDSQWSGEKFCSERCSELAWENSHTARCKTCGYTFFADDFEEEVCGDCLKERAVENE